MGFLSRTLLPSLLCISLSSCSLLEIKLESGIQPLPQEQLSMRVFTRDFSSTFYAGVEQAADTIVNKDPSVEIKANTLLWKIYAEQNLGQTIFQVSPIAAMIDTWAFTAQMAEFFNQGSGNKIFGDNNKIAAKTSEQLLQDYVVRMKGIMDKADFKKNQAFITQYIKQHPLQSIEFARTSAFSEWLKYRNISESEAVTTFGTVPEVMTDMSDRVAMIANQTPKILGWKAELFALYSNINTDEIHQTLKDISATSAKFQSLMANSPEMMNKLAIDMRTELSPLLDKLDASVDKNFAQLTNERKALESMVERERIALETMVTNQRVAITKDTNALVQKTVTQVFAEISTLIKSVIIYIILFLVIVFFAPLGMGIWLGKKIGFKQAKNK